MTDEERFALFCAPLSESEKALDAEIARIVSAAPWLRLASRALGRLPDEPHEATVRSGRAEDENEREETFRFFDVGEFRRFVLGLARREAESLGDSVAALRRTLDERTAQARACESAIVELEGQVKR